MQSQRQVWKRTVATQGGPVVATNLLGAVLVTEGVADDLSVEVVIEAAPADLDSVQLVVEGGRSGARVHLDTRAATWQGWAEVRLTLPERSSYEVTAFADEVRLEGLYGRGVARTQSGAIRATGMQGDCDLRTVSGAVSLRQSHGVFRLESVSGAIDVAAAPSGLSSAATVSGSISLQLTGPGRVETRSIAGSHTPIEGDGPLVSLASTSGSIQVTPHRE